MPKSAFRAICRVRERLPEGQICAAYEGTIQITQVANLKRSAAQLLIYAGGTAIAPYPSLKPVETSEWPGKHQKSSKCPWVWKSTCTRVRCGSNRRPRANSEKVEVGRLLLQARPGRQRSFRLYLMSIDPSAARRWSHALRDHARISSGARPRSIFRAAGQMTPSASA
jgi:hypothetical protein